MLPDYVVLGSSWAFVRRSADRRLGHNGDALAIVQTLVEHQVSVLVLNTLDVHDTTAPGGSLAERMRRLVHALTDAPCALLALTTLPDTTLDIDWTGERSSRIGAVAALRLHVTREAWQLDDVTTPRAARVCGYGVGAAPQPARSARSRPLSARRGGAAMMRFATVLIPNLRIALAYRDDPTLVERPLLLYATHGRRATVSAASDAAAGPVGLPLREVLVRWPDAVVRRANPTREAQAVARLRTLLEHFSARLAPQHQGADALVTADLECPACPLLWRRPGVTYPYRLRLAEKPTQSCKGIEPRRVCRRINGPR
jgi:hypothetical protein